MWLASRGAFDHLGLFDGLLHLCNLLGIVVLLVAKPDTGHNQEKNSDSWDESAHSAGTYRAVSFRNALHSLLFLFLGLDSSLENPVVGPVSEAVVIGVHR